MPERHDALDSDSDTREWVFRLSYLQRLLNPPGVFLLLCGLGMTELVLAYLLVRFPGAFYGLIPLLVMGALMFRGCYRGSYPSGYSTQLKLCVRIGDGAFAYGPVGKPEWIPRKNIVRLGRGLFGCSILGLMSGHALTIPTPITRSESFTRFFEKDGEKPEKM